jgi:hypothetical protein
MVRDGKIALPKHLDVFAKTEKYYSIKKLQYFSLCAKILQFFVILYFQKNFVAKLGLTGFVYALAEETNLACVMRVHATGEREPLVPRLLRSA